MQRPQSTTSRDELLDEETGLTRNQFLIWLGQEAAPDKPIFNEQSVYIIHGELDLARFHAAFQRVIDEADALRTTITRVQGRPRAEVHPQMEFRSGFIDLSASADIDGDLEAWALQNVDTVIDLSARPFESTILKLAPDRYAWGFVCHQILTDASSITLMYQRVSAWYLRLSRPDSGPSLQEEPSFASYVERELAQADTPEHRIREAYWNQRVSNPPDPVVFYDGRTAPNSVSHRHRVDHPLGPELTQAVREFAQTDGIRAPSDNLSVYSVFCAALIAYLHKLSGHERVAIGTTWHNRQRPYQSAIGLFMVQNPFDVSVGADDTFRTLVKKVQSEALDTKRHLPHAAGNPGGRAYDVTLNYVNVRFGPFADMPIDHHWYRPSYGDGSMQVQVHEFDGSQELTLSIDFSDDVFEAADRDAVFAHYSACLTRLMADPDLVIDSVPMITDAERVEVEAWNATERDYPREDTVVDLFRQQADRRPDAVAVSCGDERLTYAQLSQRVQDVARELRAVGVVPGTSVGVFLNRSVDLLVGVLAVLWAGGAYVPLDPAFPRERLDYMLEDSGAHVVLTQTGLHGDLDVGDRPTVSVDRPGGRANGAGEQPVRPDAEGLAYVLYTSGSTGRPKGVEIPHRALTNFLCAMAEEPGCGENDVLLAVTTLSFDIAGLELFLPLVTGGHVEIAGRETATDGRLLRARLDSGGITILQATPATWRMLIDAGWEGTPGLKALIGGEPLPPDLVQPLIDRTDSLWNMYGPTETTIWSSVQRMASAPSVIGIGRPLANTRFHIVDAALQPVPVGVAGELLISGDGLARGYRGRPELTAEKFTALPMNGRGAGVRVYRTGDLVRLTRAGQLVHLGRLDQQVKIRGFRVEVGEVEAALAAHDAVKHAVVVAHRAGTAAARLVAYIVPTGDVPTAADLRRHLRASLPDYMVPQQFTMLAEVPLTPNGKVDRRRLPDPDDGMDAAPARGTTAMSPMQARVAAAFCQILDLTGVGVDDDFFELGGQSILALRLISQLGEEFGVDLPLQVLFEASTVGALSRRLTTLVSTTPELRTVSLEGTDLEQKLRSVWRAAVGLEPPADDESAVSLTDAQIVRLLARVRQEFGVAAEGLSAVEFRSDPSVTGLARLLRDALDPPPALVVPLQPHGDRAPLFLVHAGGGYVFFYRALAARLGPDQPVHAIRAATRADSHRHPFDRTVSIENLAARYIEEMKTIQPEGPYRLGGSCFGGVVAFEMAQQLLARGESVGAPVLLFDSYLGKMGEDWRDYASRTLSSVADRLGVDSGAGPAGLARAIMAGIVTRPVEVLRLAPLTVRSLLRRGLARLRGARIRQWVRGTMPGQKGRSGEQGQLDTMREFLTRSIELVAKYQPKRYPGRAVLLKATVGPDPEPLWTPWLAEGLQVHVMPGEHLDMMEEPWVQQTAHQVRQALG